MRETSEWQSSRVCVLRVCVCARGREQQTQNGMAKNGV